MNQDDEFKVISFEGDAYIDQIFALFESGRASRNAVGTVLARAIESVLKQVHPENKAVTIPTNSESGDRS